MKKVLVTDFLCAEAHQKFNIDTIDCLSKNFEVTVINVNGYYDGCVERWHRVGIESIGFTVQPKQQGKFRSRKFPIDMMKISGDACNNCEYDMVIALAFDTVAMLAIKYFIKDVPVLAYHHKNIDDLASNTLRFVFKLYKRNIIHIVFEEQFKDYLIKTIHVPEDKCIVIPHPIKEQNVCGSNDYTCVGLCNCNSERFLSGFDELDEEDVKGVKIVLRTKENRHNKESITYVKGFLEDAKYYSYIDNTRFILVAVPETYKYRISGSIYDALSRKKIVLTTSKFFADHYGLRYPGTCVYVENAADVICRIHNNDDHIVNTKAFEHFIEEHSLERVASCMANLLSNIT